MTGAGCGPIISYAQQQQIHQFLTLGEDFAMQHTDTQYLGEWDEDLKTAVLELIPPEDRLRGLTPEDRLRGLAAEDRLRGLAAEDRLRGLPAEDRLRGLPAEDRLRGLPAEAVVRGLSEQELARLRTMLAQEREA